MTTVTFNTAGASSWVVPDDVNLIICRAWGAGSPAVLWAFGGAFIGGGGGAFAGHTTGIPVTPGQTVYYQVGAGNNANYHSWVNINANAQPTHRDHGVLADGAFNTGNNDFANHGTAADSIGDVRYDGGEKTTNTTGRGGAGSGGAASGSIGGTPDGGNGGAPGNVGAQPGGGGGGNATSSNGGAGRIQFEYTPVATDTVTPLDFTGPVASLGSPAAYEVPGRAAFFAERIGEPYVALVTISHPSIDPPIRAVINTSDVVSRGDTFKASFAEFTLPTRGDGRQTAQISIANVDRAIGIAAQSLLTPAEILFEIVDATLPDIVVIAYPPMLLTNITGNAIAVSGDLDSMLQPQDQYPRLRATKGIAPGIFR